MLKTLQRYVLKDVLKTFFLAVTVFTGIVLLGIIYEFVRAELSLGQMLRLIPYGLPFTLPFTLPIAALLATSLTFGRMSVDNEITAIRTSGIPIGLIIFPMICFGLLTSGFSLYLQDRVIPPLHYKLRDTRMLAAEILMDQKEGYNFRRKFDRFQIFASYIHGSEYEGLVVFHRTKTQRMKFVAQRGRIGLGEGGNTLEFTVYDGSFVPYRRDDDRSGRRAGKPVRSQARVTFPEYTLKIPIRERSPRESDKSTPVLLKEAAFHKSSRDSMLAKIAPEIRITRAAIATLEQELDAASGPDERKEIEAEIQSRRSELRRLRHGVDYSERTYFRNVAEANGRWSLAFGCLLSVVLGTGLPILMRPKNALIPFFAGILIVILFYFPLHRLGLSLGKEGTVSPWVGPWIPDLLGGVFGGLLLWKVLVR